MKPRWLPIRIGSSRSSRSYTKKKGREQSRSTVLDSSHVRTSCEYEGSYFLGNQYYRNFILKSDIKIMRVAYKGNVAGNVGIIMTMITNNYFTQGDSWGPPTPPPPKKKEAEERHELLKMVLMEFTDDQSRTDWEQVPAKITTPSNGVGWINVSILIENPVKYNRSSLSESTGLSIKFLLEFFMPGGFLSLRLNC